MRSFIAIDLPEVFIKKIKVLQDKLKRDCKAKVSWSAPENIHLTLKFLGEVQEVQLDAITTAIKNTCIGINRFELSVNGINGFPNLNSPRVIWLGIKTCGNLLQTIYERLEAVLADLGFEKEKRRFSPHLTLGRIREPDKETDFKGILAHVKDAELGEFIADGIVLYKSELNPKGAVYTKLYECPLTPSTPLKVVLKPFPDGEREKERGKRRRDYGSIRQE
ncbi:MAG: RNA 2',3'-cyclic phosphodiesterase [Deltaproteobacteria bacterium]|nr:RNA 2',3'-cyclic phosphodiesterase [Deltaproteobacteria bacterium]